MISPLFVLSWPNNVACLLGRRIPNSSAMAAVFSCERDATGSSVEAAAAVIA